MYNVYIGIYPPILYIAGVSLFITRLNVAHIYIQFNVSGCVLCIYIYSGTRQTRVINNIKLLFITRE